MRCIYSRFAPTVKAQRLVNAVCLTLGYNTVCTAIIVHIIHRLRQLPLPLANWPSGRRASSRRWYKPFSCTPLVILRYGDICISPTVIMSITCRCEQWGGRIVAYFWGLRWEEPRAGPKMPPLCQPLEHKTATTLLIITSVCIVWPPKVFHRYPKLFGTVANTDRAKLTLDTETTGKLLRTPSRSEEACITQESTVV